MPPPSIHARLREETTGHHRRLDEGLGDVLGDGLSRTRYVRLLEAFWGFHTPLEQIVRDWEHGLTLPLVPRATLLERDLLACGVSPLHLPACRMLPELPTVDHVAGAIYVIEGSCLGGQVIARALARRLGITAEDGAAFFTGDGPRTGVRWRQVLTWLEAHERMTGAGDAMVAGACRTFEAFAAWLAEREVLDA